MAFFLYLLFVLSFLLLCVTGVSFRQPWQQCKGFLYVRSLETLIKLFFVIKMPLPLNELHVKSVFAQTPSIPLPSLLLWLSFALGVFVFSPVCLHRTDSFLPSQYSAPLRAFPYSHGNGLKRTNCFCKKSLLFSQCSLLLPPQIPSSCLREASSDFLSGNHGLETQHFLCIYWSRSCSSELQVPQTLLCLPCFFLSHNLTCCWVGDTAVHLFLWLSCGNTSERFGSCGRMCSRQNVRINQ